MISAIFQRQVLYSYARNIVVYLQKIQMLFANTGIRH